MGLSIGSLKSGMTSDGESSRVYTTAEAGNQETGAGYFHISKLDLIIVSLTLRKAFKSLPDTIIGHIIELSGLSAVDTVETRTLCNGEDNENRLHLQLITTRHQQRKLFHPSSIEIIVDSRDQGWTSEPGISGQRLSHTFGELCIDGQRYFCYRNIAAGKRWEVQVTQLAPGSQLMQIIKSTWEQFATSTDPRRDPFYIQFWVRSLYPGWRNRIRYASIRLYWTINLNVLFEGSKVLEVDSKSDI